VIEGVAVVRALRKWIQLHPLGEPADVVFWGDEPYEQLSPGQSAMAKGSATIWRSVCTELLARGQTIKRIQNG
jgi:hypothetical protein